MALARMASALVFKRVPDCDRIHGQRVYRPCPAGASHAVQASLHKKLLEPRPEHLDVVLLELDTWQAHQTADNIRTNEMVRGAYI